MVSNQNFHRESQHRGRLMKKIKKKKKEERSQSQHRVRLMKKINKKKKVKDLVRLLTGFTDEMEVYARSQFQNRVQLMEKRKKKIKVTGFSDKRMPANDVYFIEKGILQQDSVKFMKGRTYSKQKVVPYVCNVENWQLEMNFALLELNLRDQEAQILPPAILSTYGPPSEMREIDSIGYSDGGGVDPSFITEERKCLVIYPNNLLLMNRELRYHTIPCSFTRPLGCIIFEEIFRFVNRASHSAGALYYESHGNIRRVTEYNGSTILESLIKERIEKTRELAIKCKYTVSVTEERSVLENWQGFRHWAAVCCICVNGLPEGTGFLLFDRYILTNVHVIIGTIKEGILQEVSVKFMKGGTYSPPLTVKPKVVAYMCNVETCQWEMDFALLELDLQEHEVQILPPAILSTYGPPSEMGGISICGHPGGGGKRIDESFIIDEKYLDKYLTNVQGTLLHYHTTMLHGSSGSPIIGDNSHLLGMHTGGHTLPDGSTIGFGIPMKFILQNLLLQMIEQNKREPLLKFIREAMKGEHTIVVIAEFIWHMLERQDVEGVLSTVNTIAKMCSGFQNLFTLLYNMGQTDSQKLMILQQYFPSLIQIPRKDDRMMEVDE